MGRVIEEEDTEFVLLLKVSWMDSLILKIIGTECSILLWSFVSLDMVLSRNLGLFLLFSINEE